jgi:hypothetical protein
VLNDVGGFGQIVNPIGSYLTYKAVLVDIEKSALFHYKNDGLTEGVGKTELHARANANPLSA